jgi:hypothetical protein
MTMTARFSMAMCATARTGAVLAASLRWYERSSDRRGVATAFMKYDRNRAVGAWLLIAFGFAEAAIVVAIFVT